MDQELLIVSTDTLPIEHEVERVWSMMSYTGRVEVSGKGLVRGLLERDRNEQQEVYDQFATLAPPEANALVGVRVSTSIGTAGGMAMLFVTYIGTPIRYRLPQG